MNTYSGPWFMLGPIGYFEKYPIFLNAKNKGESKFFPFQL